MATLTVSPSGSHWVVQRKSGHVVSNHRKKRTAKEAAMRQASTGDTIVIQRSDGTIQKRKRV